MIDPCRVMSDLSAHEYEQRQGEIEQFDEYNEDHIRQIFGKRFSSAIQDFLLTRLEVHKAQGIYALNKEKAVEHFLESADKLYRACKEEWRDR
jgi:hypothetical protein